MSNGLSLCSLGTWLALACCFGGAERTQAKPTATKFADFFQNHCISCHDANNKNGGLDLTALPINLESTGVQAKWVRIFDRVRLGEMPPKAGRLPAAEKTQFLQRLADDLTQAHTKTKGTVLRRLNRQEYERTVNQLLGTNLRLAAMLPEDGRAHGFDNIGEALDLSTSQLQRYMEAAGLALDACVTFGPKPVSKVQELRFDTGRNQNNIGENWLRRPDGAVVFFLEGNFPAIKVNEYRTPMTGRYRFRIHSAAHQSDKPIVYAVHFGRDTLGEPAVLHSFHEALPGAIRVQQVEAVLERGDTFRLYVHGLDPTINKWVAVNKKVNEFRGPGLAVLKVEVEGPLVDEWPSRGHRLRFGDLPVEDVGPKNQRDKPWYKPIYKIRSSSPRDDLAKVLPRFLEAAFRRPVDAETAAPYLALAEQELKAGQPLDQALRTAQVAALCSPDFLYLWEPVGPLDDHALAARLSYLFWGLPPDAELLRLARAKKLTDPATLRQQTERLLQDPRAGYFTRNFTDQWLNLRDIDFTTPDKQLYPEYDDLLRDAMLQETRLFFDEVLRHNRSVMTFIDSDWTFVNERLAKHYRIPGVQGLAMQKVPLKPEYHRGGVLTHASVLKVSANGTTTSPVTRGAYLLERILGITPPPPPPGVPGVEPDIRGATTLREQLDKHRSLKTCNACHRVIDPPGFALENYDVMGGWRTNYRSLGKDFPRPDASLTGGRPVQWRIGPAVDASGETPNGQRFRNLTDYKRLLQQQPQTITRALAETLATHASGRLMGFSDRPELDRIAQTVVQKGNGFRDLVHEVIQSDLFRRK